LGRPARPHTVEVEGDLTRKVDSLELQR
jgi:hypothetical protein